MRNRRVNKDNRRLSATLLVALSMTFTLGLTTPNEVGPEAAPTNGFATVVPKVKKKLEAMSVWMSGRFSNLFKPATPVEIRANDTYLRDMTVGVVSRDADSMFLTHRRAKELELQFIDMNRDYDNRSAYGLTDDVDSQSKYNDRMRGFSRSVLGSVQSRQIENNSDKIDRVQGMAGDTPKAIVGAMYVLATGAPIKMKISDRWRLVARSHAIEQRGGLQMESPLFDSSLDYAGRGLDSGPDRYRLSLSRSLPLELRSGVSYGGGTRLLSTSLSRELMTNLSLVFSVQSRSTQSEAQQAAQFVYGVQF